MQQSGIEKRTLPPIPKFDANKIVVRDQKQIRMVIQNTQKKLNGIRQELSDQIIKLNLEKLDSTKVESYAQRFLTQDILDTLKSRKYFLVAQTAITHAVACLYDSKIFRQFLSRLENQELIIKTILYLERKGKITANYLVGGLLGRVNQRLGLNEKFSEVCDRIRSILSELNLLDNHDPENNVATVLKIAGDIIFARDGGIKNEAILKHVKCSEEALTHKISRIIPFSQQILDRYLEIRT